MVISRVHIIVVYMNFCLWSHNSSGSIRHKLFPVI